jgi:predicted branched-subunit amino acid permease
MPAQTATFWQGAKDSQAIVLTYLPVSFAFGVSASQFGFSPWEAFFFLVQCMLVLANFCGLLFWLVVHLFG